LPDPQSPGGEAAAKPSSIDRQTDRVRDSQQSVVRRTRRTPALSRLLTLPFSLRPRLRESEWRTARKAWFSFHDDVIPMATRQSVVTPNERRASQERGGRIQDSCRPDRPPTGGVPRREEVQEVQVVRSFFFLESAHFMGATLARPRGNGQGRNRNSNSSLLKTTNDDDDEPASANNNQPTTLSLRPCSRAHTPQESPQLYRLVISCVPLAAAALRCVQLTSFSSRPLPPVISRSGRR
jgi:hypothetical protein